MCYVLLSVALVGMNADMARDYIEQPITLLSQLGFAKEYNTANPFDWMESDLLARQDELLEKAACR